MNIISAITFDLSRVDGNAVTIFLIGFGVVFFALLVIYLIFSTIPRFLDIKIPKKTKVENKNAETAGAAGKSEINNEVYAAIAMALSLHFEDHHDEESMILTIDLHDRLNSPWSAKVQNVISKN